MKAGWLLAVLCALAFGGPAGAAEALVLKRGIGIHEWFNWAPLDGERTGYRHPLYQSVEQWRTRYRDLSDWRQGDEFERIKAMGFDFVRLTVDPGPLLADDGRDRAEGLAILADGLRQVTGAGLKAVFDFHLVPQLEPFSQEAIEGPVYAPQIETYRALLTDTARMLVTIGVDKVAFEPMNEPQYYPCDGWAGADWQVVMTGFVATIRAVSADLTIIATGACGGGPDGLLALDPRFDDRAVLYSFHMYEPHSFTHQGTGDKLHLAGLPWPASARARQEVEAFSRRQMSDEGPGSTQQRAALAELDGTLTRYYDEAPGSAQMAARFAAMAGWAEGHGIAPSRLFVGEFGATAFRPDRGGAIEADRLRYLGEVRRLAERYGMGWSMWEYSNPHGMSLIQPEGSAVPDPGVLEALGLE